MLRSSSETLSSLLACHGEKFQSCFMYFFLPASPSLSAGPPHRFWHVWCFCVRVHNFTLWTKPRYDKNVNYELLWAAAHGGTTEGLRVHNYCIVRLTPPKKVADASKMRLWKKCQLGIWNCQKNDSFGLQMKMKERRNERTETGLKDHGHLCCLEARDFLFIFLILSFPVSPLITANKWGKTSPKVSLKRNKKNNKKKIEGYLKM